MNAKTISLAEFEALIARGDWQRTQDYDIIDRIAREEMNKVDEETGEVSRIEIPHAYGWAAKTSTLDDIKITYHEGFDYDECEPDSLSTGTSGQDEVWTIEGVVVVDEDGDELKANELADYLSSDFSSIDYSALKAGIEEVIDIDVDSSMQTFTLEIDNAPNIRFTGEMIAHTASSENQATGSNYSRQAGRWTELSLYKTTGGNFLCHKIGRTIWQGERGRFAGKVCENLAEVKEFFGHGWLSKALYAEAGIDDAVEVD